MTSISTAPSARWPMAVRGFRPELWPLTLAGSPLTISRGPKVMASRMPFCWASLADILLMIMTLSWLKPTVA